MFHGNRETGINFLKKHMAICFSVFLLMILSPAVMAEGKYQSSGDSEAVRKWCSYNVSDLKNGGSASISDDFSKRLGDCVMQRRDLERRMTLNYTNCDMLTLAVAESCSGFWGPMGRHHNACVNERSNLIGRNPAWVRDFGYCHTACPSVNLPLPNQPPFNLPPCGLKVIPPDLENITINY